jgi:prefoldin subunit 5
MSQKLKLDNIEYNLNDLNDEIRGLVASLKNIEANISENQKLIAVLTRARNSYIRALNKKVLANKAGLDLFE